MDQSAHCPPLTVAMLTERKDILKETSDKHTMQFSHALPSLPQICSRCNLIDKNAIFNHSSSLINDYATDIFLRWPGQQAS